MQLQPVSIQYESQGVQITDQEARAMQRAVVNLFERWGLTDKQSATLLGGIATRTYQRWKTGSYGRVDIDLRARLSNLLGIHKALRVLFREPQRGYDWIKRDNAVFNHNSALDIMLRGELTDLMRIRRYLDARKS